MSDLSGIVDNISNGHLSSEDVEMTDHNAAEEQESDGKEQEMDDLFGHEVQVGDHGNFARFVSPQFAQKTHCQLIFRI